MSTSPLDRGAGGEGASGELVKVAFARDGIEGEMIQGLLEGAGIPSLLRQVGLSVDGPRLGFGHLPGFEGGPQRVMVHANRAEQARILLAETLVEDEYEDEDEAWRDTANAKFLEKAGGGGADGGRVRNYGLVGAYARATLWSAGVMAVAFGVFLLLRVV